MDKAVNESMSFNEDSILKTHSKLNSETTALRFYRPEEEMVTTINFRNFITKKPQKVKIKNKSLFDQPGDLTPVFKNSILY